MRRKFYDIHVATDSPIAEEALHRIGELYDIEKEIRGQPPDHRRRVRQARAGPKLEALKNWLIAELRKLPKKSELAGAIRYALSRWTALVRYRDDGRVEIDNNAAERALRAVALGRRNYLFAGSDAGGERAAAIYSLMGTAKLNGIDPEAYLRYVLGRIAEHLANRVAELLSWNSAGELNNRTTAAAQKVMCCMLIRGEALKRVLTLMLAVYCIGPTPWVAELYAQTAPPNLTALPPVPPLPLGATDRKEPSPSWLVWRAFHDSLEFYAERSPETVAQLLTERLGLLPAEIDLLTAAGREYLQELSRIDGEARDAIRRNYVSGKPVLDTSRSQQQFPSAGELHMPRNAVVMRSDLIPGWHAEGGMLREMLNRNGFIQSVESQRSKAATIHEQRIRQALGAEQFRSLEQWMQADVAPKVGIARYAAPAALPPGFDAPRPIGSLVN